MEDMKRISVVMDEALHQEIVQLQKKYGTFSRSEMIRNLIHKALDKEPAS